MTQSTHDEVMAWIDSKIAKFKLAQRQSGDDSEHEWWEISIASLLANKATLERHEPIPDKDGLRSLCKFCADGMWAVKAPCPSLLDVTNQIDLVMGASND